MIRRTFLALTAAASIVPTPAAFAAEMDIVDTAVGAGTFTTLAAALTAGMKAATVNGADITITLEGGTKVNGVTISAADIVASNGVIHVIDAVIMPPM